MIGSRQEGLSRRGNRIASNALSSRVRPGRSCPSIPDVSHFPFETWRRLVSKQMRLEQRHLAQYGYGGYGPLKTVLADYLRVTRMMACSPQQIMILNRLPPGTRPVRAAAWRRRRHGVDGRPGYWGARNVLAAADLAIKPVPWIERHRSARRRLEPPSADDLRPRLLPVPPPARCSRSSGGWGCSSTRKRIASGSSRTTTTTRFRYHIIRWPRCSDYHPHSG